MARWNNEDAYDAAVNVAAANYAVPPELIKAIIAQESRFIPSAERAEVAVADKSVGLMQILYATAKGEGYTGPIGDGRTLTGLYEPLTNITYGTSFLASMLQQARGDVAAAISAYNGGWRPSIGFGAVATKPMTICLRRDIQGRCMDSRQVAPGQFSNQDYVNKVLSNYDYFRAKTQQQSTIIGGKTSSIPLGDAHQYYVEPEIGGRDSGADSRSVWTSIWKAVIQLCKFLLGKAKR